MKMNKKGFTLIELLAVIVILAIIALIATPIVLNVVNTAKEKAAVASANNVVNAINNNLQMKSMATDLGVTGSYQEITITSNKITTLPTGVVTGDQPKAVSLTVSNNVVTEGCVAINGYKVTVSNGSATSTGITTGDSCS